MLVILLVASTALRAAWLSEPHVVASDEIFYVNAARHIASVPVGADDPYAVQPLGVDPNFEHPPLAKVILAASIRLFGNRPGAWRLPAILFGTLAIALLYWLARSAGASQWQSLAAAGIMAADNMTMVYGRFATLDMFVVVFMLLGVGLYLRDRPLWAGVALGVGACTKLVGLSAIAVIVLIELLRRAETGRGFKPDRAARVPSRWKTSGRLAACTFAAASVYLMVLGILDQTVTDFPDPVTHTRQMLNYAERTTFELEAQSRGTWTQGKLAPVARPWEWLLNTGTFTVYHKEAGPSGQPGSDHRLVLFEARITPAILWLALPALLLAALHTWLRPDDVSNLAVAWFLAIFALLVAVVLRGRITYIYYSVILLPGIYLAIAKVLSHARVPSILRIVYGLVLVASLLESFPFRTWAGR